MAPPKGVVDPGHGGPDPGAADPIEPQEGDFLYTEEEDITLDIGLGVASLLGPVFDIDMTRTDDTALADFRKDLVRRARIGDGAAWFVSIHLNSSDNDQAHGTETYYLRGSAEGKALAEAIQKRLIGALGLTDRDVKEAGFAVLKTTAKAAALVEACFVSNPKEEILINQSEAKDTVARAIALGICDYMGVELKGADGDMPETPEKWMYDVLKDAKEAGLLSSEDHDPLKKAGELPLWFLLALMMNFLKAVKAAVKGGS